LYQSQNTHHPIITSPADQPIDADFDLPEDFEDVLVGNGKEFIDLNEDINPSGEDEFDIEFKYEDNHKGDFSEADIFHDDDGYQPGFEPDLDSDYFNDANDFSYQMDDIDDFLDFDNEIDEFEVDEMYDEVEPEAPPEPIHYVHNLNDDEDDEYFNDNFDLSYGPYDENDDEIYDADINLEEDDDDLDFDLDDEDFMKMMMHGEFSNAIKESAKDGDPTKLIELFQNLLLNGRTSTNISSAHIDDVLARKRRLSTHIVPPNWPRDEIICPECSSKHPRNKVCNDYTYNDEYHSGELELVTWRFNSSAVEKYVSAQLKEDKKNKYSNKSLNSEEEDDDDNDCKRDPDRFLYAEDMGEFGTLMEEEQMMRDAFEACGQDYGKMYEKWSRSFRWTCCGSDGDISTSCDHHGM
jgi:hypothetical protein